MCMCVCAMFSPLDSNDWLSICVYRVGSVCFSLCFFHVTVYISIAKTACKISFGALVSVEDLFQAVFGNRVGAYRIRPAVTGREETMSEL